MKKIKLFLLALLVSGGAAHAQYFQHTYGLPNNQDVLESGVNANLAAGPQGHVMAGYTNSGIAAMNAVMVTRTDLNGNIPAVVPFFNNRYQLFQGGVPQNTQARRLVQHNSGRILVWGDYSNAAGALSTQFFYLQLNPGGGPVFARRYTLPWGPMEVEATSMCLSPTQLNNFFVCGWARDAAGLRYPVVMCLNIATGAIVWSSQYAAPPGSDWTAMDIVESPYPTSSGVPDLALVGHLRLPGAPVENGCFFTVSSTTGANTSPINTYGTPVDNSGLDAIEISANGFGCPPGFVAGGYSFNPATGNNDFWALKFDPPGVAIGFSTLVDYSIVGNNDEAYDIIERFSMVNGFEYYLGGVTANGIFGATDAVVNKLDFSGVPVPAGGEFTYGGPGFESAAQLDQYNGLGPNNDGLSMYGNTMWSFPLGANDFYLVKAYFNGVTACNYNVVAPPWMPGPMFNGPHPPMIVANLVWANLTINVAPMQDFQICFMPVVGGGSNARIAPDDQSASSLPGTELFPNPVSRDHAVVSLLFEAPAAGEVQLELWNTIGQLVWKKQAALADGQAQLQVELGDELEAGVYLLKVRHGENVSTHRIAVK